MGFILFTMSAFSKHAPQIQTEEKQSARLSNQAVFDRKLFRTVAGFAINKQSVERDTGSKKIGGAASVCRIRLEYILVLYQCNITIRSSSVLVLNSTIFRL